MNINKALKILNDHKALGKRIPWSLISAELDYVVSADTLYHSHKRDPNMDIYRINQLIKNAKNRCPLKPSEIAALISERLGVEVNTCGLSNRMHRLKAEYGTWEEVMERLVAYYKQKTKVSEEKAKLKGILTQ